MGLDSLIYIYNKWNGLILSFVEEKIKILHMNSSLKFEASITLILCMNLEKVYKKELKDKEG